MSEKRPRSGVTHDGYSPRPAGGREQAGHQPTTGQRPAGPPPNQGGGGQKKGTSRD